MPSKVFPSLRFIFLALWVSLSIDLFSSPPKDQTSNPKYYGHSCNNSLIARYQATYWVFQWLTCWNPSPGIAHRFTRWIFSRYYNSSSPHFTHNSMSINNIRCQGKNSQEKYDRLSVVQFHSENMTSFGLTAASRRGPAFLVIVPPQPSFGFSQDSLISYRGSCIRPVASPLHQTQQSRGYRNYSN